ncbi:MAG: dihydroorotase [Spirochaetales bacterium]|nr:dihydroorotase [Spirochaetales bacterium]
MHELTMRAPDDFHVHLRQGPAMAAYASRSAACFARFLVMPNVVPPPVSAVGVADYRRAVESALATSAHRAATLMSFKIVPGMGRDAVLACAGAGAVAGKYYPAGAITNSADGVPGPEAVHEGLAAMEDAGLVLSIHGEDPLAPVLEREEGFLPVVDSIVARYPRLRVVLEHLSTAAAVDAVRNWPVRVAATITAHHLSFTIDDLAGERLDPGYFCKPLLKTARDRNALVAAAISGDGRFFFGSDSAPHPPAAKATGAAGVYAAPVAISLAATVFEGAGALDRLERFVSESGARFYGLPLNEGGLRLTREPWTVPAELDGVVPLAAGTTQVWRASRV